MSQLNKVRFQQFLRQAKGLQLQEIHVNRVDKRKHVVLQYNGRTPKAKQRLTAEWQIVRGERDEQAIAEDVKAFLEEARKHFFVHRGQGLEGEVYADPTMEAKAKPIVATEGQG